MPRGTRVSSRKLRAEPILDDPTHKALAILGPDAAPAAPTHFSFGQLATLVKAPAAYLRTLPNAMVADCINYGLFRRDAEDVGALLRQNGALELAAATGPNYGRIWNADVVGALVKRFGDGITGQFTVPGEFAKKVEVTKANTTLFAGDRDMFVFLADEQNRIEVPGRRPGLTGSLARGFFVWNSEVGDKTLGIGTFLYDFVCCNRMVWGAEGYEEIRVRHTISAPDKFVDEVAPALEAYANKSTASITSAIESARDARIATDKVDDFLRSRKFTTGQAQGIMMAHMAEEQRPIETVWDAAVGITAYAKGITYQDDRVALERRAGQLLKAAS
jgi:hypothetical protein